MHHTESIQSQAMRLAIDMDGRSRGATFWVRHRWQARGALPLNVELPAVHWVTFTLVSIGYLTGK